MQILHWNYISTCFVHLSLFIQKFSFIENEQKQKLNPQTDDDKWSHSALFWLFSLCQFRDSTVDSRRTCYCAVTICHFCTVIVSFCSNASELIWADSSRTLTQKEASAGGEMRNLCPAEIYDLSFYLFNLWHDFIRTWVLSKQWGSFLPDTSIKRWQRRSKVTHTLFFLGCKGAADRMPCHPQSPWAAQQWQ